MKSSGKLGNFRRSKNMSSTVIAAIIASGVNIVILLINLCFSKKSKEEQNKIAKDSIKVQKEIANQNIDARIRRQNKLEDIKEWSELSSQLIEAFNSCVSLEIKNIDNATTSVHYSGVSSRSSDYESEEYKAFWQRNTIRYDRTMKNFELYKEYKFKVVSLGQQLKMRLFNKETETDTVEKVNDLIVSVKCINRELEEKRVEVIDQGLTIEDTKNFKNCIQDKTWKNIESFVKSFKKFLKEELDTVAEQERNKSI